MPRPSHRRPSNAPVYREVLSQAFHAAWSQPRYWPLAFFAALLFTAGSYDVVLTAFVNIRDQGALLVASGQISAPAVLGLGVRQAVSSVDSALHIASGIEAIIVIAVTLLAIVALSCICQGALVYALGAAKRGGRPTLLQALRVGGGAFWPVAALNALTLTTLWILRFLAAFPLFLALERTTQGVWFLYLLSFMVFVALSFVVSIVEVFALNAMVLQGASVQQAIIRGYALFKKNWVTAVETAALLFCAAIALSILFLGLLLVVSLPLFAMLIVSGVTQSVVLFYGTAGLWLALFFIGMFAAAAFLAQFQYATWTFLYRKLGEGGILPKLHRFLRALTGSYAVPR